MGCAPRAPNGNDAPNDVGLPDKWTILDHLTDAAPALGISHRSLAVLRALVSFHPARQLAPVMGAAVVFPSNRTLASRLGGMPESTLRRHIAHLVAAGLITRRDSANRKRYCRRSSVQELAFGFDLGPLALQATAIAELSREAQETQRRIQQLRSAVLALRQQLAERLDAVNELMSDLARALRRKLDLASWTALYERAKQALEENCQLTKTPHVGGSDTQNERHIEPDQRNKKNNDWVVRVTAAAQEFCLAPIQTQTDANQAAEMIAPMIGLSSSDLLRMQRRFGGSITSLAVFTLMACFETVSATRRAFERLLRMQNPMDGMERLLPDAKLSADKSNIHAISYG